MSEKTPDPALKTENDHALDWQVRTFVYQFMVDHEHLPSVDETAQGLGLTRDQVEQAYRWLNDKHALFLDPAQADPVIRIANPFSAIPTAFQVQANGHTYQANCAWDSFGILAMLHTDGEIMAHYASDDEPLRIAVETGQLRGDQAVVHFLLPFRQWYDNLIFT